MVFVALSSCELEEPGPEAWRLNLWAVVEPQVPVSRPQAGPEAEFGQLVSLNLQLRSVEGVAALSAQWLSDLYVNVDDRRHYRKRWPK